MENIKKSLLLLSLILAFSSLSFDFFDSFFVSLKSFIVFLDWSPFYFLLFFFFYSFLFFFINFEIVVFFIVGILLLIMFIGFNKIRKRIFVFYAPYLFVIKSGIIGLLIYLFNFVDDIDLYRRKRKNFDVIPYLIALSFNLYRI